MRAFIVSLPNRPGSLAELCEAMGAKGINLSGVAATTWGSDGAVALITNDDAGARQLLEERDVSYRDAETVAVGLEDRPGALGAAARLLADRGVNIEHVIPIGVSGSVITVALGVDDPAAAREALGDLMATGAQPI